MIRLSESQNLFEIIFDPRFLLLSTKIPQKSFKKHKNLLKCFLYGQKGSSQLKHIRNWAKFMFFMQTTLRVFPIFEMFLPNCIKTSYMFCRRSNRLRFISFIWFKSFLISDLCWFKYTWKGLEMVLWFPMIYCSTNSITKNF